MAWETRRGQRYFYTKERIGNRVVSRYVGKGETAELIARFSALRREEDEERRTQNAAELAPLLAEEQEADAQMAAVNELLHAELTAAGFTQHDRGEWRKKRCQQGNS